MTVFVYCPRCAGRSYEVLKTHAYCSSCNYSPTLDERNQLSVPQWALDALRRDWKPETEKTQCA